MERCEILRLLKMSSDNEEIKKIITDHELWFEAIYMDSVFLAVVTVIFSEDNDRYQLIDKDALRAKYGLTDSFWSSHCEGINSNSTISLVLCSEYPKQH